MSQTAAQHPLSTESAPSPSRFRLGTDEHRTAFCRMLLDTHDRYKPAVIPWPVLAPDALKRLTGLPIWDLAVQTEGNASLRVGSYAALLTDPLLKEAVEMNAFEERRHKEVLSNMVRFYGIQLKPEPEYLPPKEPEWGFMRTGISECIDSFFAFGLFAIAKRSGFFPEELVEVFEPVIQEEARHILFFVNWFAWRRRQLPLWRRPYFYARVLVVIAAILRDRLQTGKDIGGGDNFTMDGHKNFADNLSIRDLMEIALSENDRRMLPYDPRLPRPNLIPFLVRLFRPLLGKPKAAAVTTAAR